MPICQLCLLDESETGKLSKSHSIPRFMFMETKDNNGKMIACALRGDVARFTYTQEDWSEPLLCAACEKHINIRFEQPLKGQLYLRRKAHLSTTEKSKTIIRTNSNVFALSLLSIFWRCVVSKRWTFNMAALPDYISEELRTWIKQGRINDNWSKLLTIRIEEIIGPDGKRMPFLTPVLVDKNSDQTFSFKLICGGFKITITLPAPSNHLHTKSKTIRPNWNKVSIEHVHYSQIPELQKVLPTIIKHGKDFPIQSNAATYNTKI